MAVALEKVLWRLPPTFVSQSPAVVWKKWLASEKVLFFRKVFWRVPSTVLRTCLPVSYSTQCCVNCRHPYTFTVHKNINRVAPVGVFFGLMIL